jgi:hypothetical protein
MVHKDVVDGNVDQLDDEADGSHDDKTNTNSLRDLEKFLLVSCDLRSACTQPHASGLFLKERRGIRLTHLFRN